MDVLTQRRWGEAFNLSAPGANTDAIADITWPSKNVCRVTVQLATSSVFNVMVTRGGVEKALAMNDNAALTAAALYTFDLSCLKNGDTVNVQVETDSVFDILSVDEVF